MMLGALTSELIPSLRELREVEHDVRGEAGGLEALLKLLHGNLRVHNGLPGALFFLPSGQAQFIVEGRTPLHTL